MLDKKNLEQITKIVSLEVNNLRDDLEDVETKIKGELSSSRIEMRKEFREVKDRLRKLEKGQLLVLNTSDIVFNPSPIQTMTHSESLLRDPSPD